jgi:acyl-coenzyme A synthetase/AMP-(fatty) acid ligase
MGRRIFEGWLRHPPAGREAERRGVTIGEETASWAEIVSRARVLSRDLPPGRVYLVDPRWGLSSFTALVAVALQPDTMLVWANPEGLSLGGRRLGPALTECDAAPAFDGGRPSYATVTSGSQGEPKLPVGYADTLELMALQYDAVLYGSLFPQGPCPVLATCLPLEYGATFMMVIVPALFQARDLVVFPPHRWDRLRGARERTACLTVPSLLAAACAATPEPIDMSNVALVTTAGYLTASRLATVRQKFREVTLAHSYGASEIGVATWDDAPDGSLHVGRPIWGKPLWIEGAGPDGVGAVATSGIDCREQYWGKPGSLRGPDGTVRGTDAGHFDEAGNLYLDGRLDGGEKLHGITVYPRQVERHILGIRGAVDARVRVVNTNGVDRLHARVVGDLLPAEVREHCESLPELWRPTTVECLPADTGEYSDRGKL